MHSSSCQYTPILDICNVFLAKKLFAHEKQKSLKAIANVHKEE